MEKVANMFLGRMIAKDPSERLEFSKDHDGLHFIDHDLNGKFTITPSGELSGLTGCFANKGSVKLYDTKLAEALAGTVYDEFGPNHPYSYTRAFARGTGSISESNFVTIGDYTIDVERLLDEMDLQYLKLKYSSTELLEGLMNEYSRNGEQADIVPFGAGQDHSAASTNPNDRNRRSKYWKAIPSMALCSLICWPLAAVSLLGALINRWGEKLGTLGIFHHSYGFDAIAHPTNKNERINLEMKDFWIKLSNGEILCVKAFNEKGAIEYATTLITARIKRDAYKVIYFAHVNNHLPLWLVRTSDQELWLTAADDEHRAISLIMKQKEFEQGLEKGIKKYLKLKNSFLQKFFKDNEAKVTANTAELYDIDDPTNITPDLSKLTEKDVYRQYPGENLKASRNPEDAELYYDRAGGWSTWHVKVDDLAVVHFPGKAGSDEDTLQRGYRGVADQMVAVIKFIDAQNENQKKLGSPVRYYEVKTSDNDIYRICAAGDKEEKCYQSASKIADKILKDKFSKLKNKNNNPEVAAFVDKKINAVVVETNYPDEISEKPANYSSPKLYRTKKVTPRP